MCRPWQDESDDDDDDDSAEETALEVYDTVLDKVDSPVQEYQMLRGTLLSKFLSSLSFDITFVYNTQLRFPVGIGDGIWLWKILQL